MLSTVPGRDGASECPCCGGDDELAWHASATIAVLASAPSTRRNPRVLTASACHGGCARTPYGQNRNAITATVTTTTSAARISHNPNAQDERLIGCASP